MSWSIASLAGLRCRARRKELPLQEKRFAVRPWTSFLLRLPMKFAVICPSPRKHGWLGSGSGGGQSLVLRPRDDVPLALQKLKAAQIPKQKPFHTHFKTNLNIIRPDPFLGPPYGKALLLKMVRRPQFLVHVYCLAGCGVFPVAQCCNGCGAAVTAPSFHQYGRNGMSVACVARLSRPLRRCKWLLIGHRCRHAEVPSLCLPASQAMSVSKLICRRSWLEMNTPVHCKCFGQLAAGWAMPSYGARSLLGTTIARCASG